MNDLKKRLLSLAVASFMIGSTGCSKNENPIRYEVNSETNQSELVGTVPINEVNNYYVIVVNKSDKKKSFYLTYENVVYDKFLGFVSRYKQVGNNNIIFDSNRISPYGNVENIFKFINFIPTYSTLKDEYSGEEIQEVFNKVIEDYNNIKNNDEVKIYKKVK